MYSDTLIIGGGIGGLLTAAHLGHAGHSVTLIEAAKTFGGRGSSDTHEGYILNRGGHALYRRGHTAQSFKALGLEISGQCPSTQHTFLAPDDERLERLPASLFGLVKSTLLNRSEKWQLARLLSAFMRGTSVAKHLPENASFAEWLNGREPLSPLVRQIGEATARLTTYANAPERMSARATLKQLQSGLRGSVLYLDGGWQSMVNALVERARTLDSVRLISGTKASEVTRTQQGFEVITRKGRFQSQNLVVALPGRAAARLVGHLSPQLNDTVKRATPIFAAALDIALSKLPNPATRFVLGLHEPTYFSVHSLDAQLTPNDAGAVVHAMWYHKPGQEERDPAVVRERLERLVTRAQPGWRDHVVHARYLPKMEVAGAVFETDARRSPVFEDCPGLYAVGDWCGHTGMLVDASAASARFVSDRVLATAQDPPAQMAS